MDELAGNNTPSRQNPILNALVEAGMDLDRRVRSTVEELAESDTDGHKAFLLSKAYRFEDRNKDEWEQLCQLVKHFQVSEDELRLGIGSVETAHRWRGRAGHELVHKANECANIAAAQLLEFSDLLLKLNGISEELEGAYSFAAKAHKFQYDELYVNTFQLRLHLLAGMLRLTGASIFLATGIDFEKHKGRRQSPYLFPVFKLIILWESLSKENMPTAKGTAKGKDDQDLPAQPAVQFVYYAMKILTTSFTAANAITSVNKALKLRKAAETQLYEGPNINEMIELFARDR